jgi:hypothetical protein
MKQLKKHDVRRLTKKVGEGEKLESGKVKGRVIVFNPPIFFGTFPLSNFSPFPPF